MKDYKVGDKFKCIKNCVSFVKSDIVELVKNEKYICDDNTPYELYLEGKRNSWVTEHELQTYFINYTECKEEKMEELKMTVQEKFKGLLINMGKEALEKSVMCFTNEKAEQYVRENNYKEWVKSVIVKENIPNEMSLIDLNDLFDKELKELFEQERFDFYKLKEETEEQLAKEEYKIKEKLYREYMKNLKKSNK
jgi:hypothetical protein